MNKPQGYTVYDIDPIMDWITNNYEVSTKQISKFIDNATELSDGRDLVFLSTEDCKNIPLLKEVLDEFGTVTWTNRGGVDQYEIHLAL